MCLSSIAELPTTTEAIIPPTRRPEGTIACPLCTKRTMRTGQVNVTCRDSPVWCDQYGGCWVKLLIYNIYSEGIIWCWIIWVVAITFLKALYDICRPPFQTCLLSVTLFCSEFIKININLKYFRTAWEYLKSLLGCQLKWFDYRVCIYVSVIRQKAHIQRDIFTYLRSGKQVFILWFLFIFSSKLVFLVLYRCWWSYN